ncbi:CAP domain-containing protein [Butyrivibrio sp. NC2002]|uniref:CAP domain-containing protein n=1 Tax=Butyrivibrio sp. NC2002 TaxID=1410610 RepID=UPI00055D4EED|nr:CAP domain-containing protein [Butyrivibrio sp. NC2002]
MKKIIRHLLLSLFFISIFNIKVYAQDTVTLPVTGTYNESAARGLLPLINSYRSDQGKTAYIYDQELEDAAMQRAMEISVYSDKNRPDGRDWKTVLSTSDYANQLYAYGQKDAATVFNAWKKNESNNMAISASVYKYMGAACVNREGTNFWVVLLCESAGSASPEPALVSVKTVNIVIPTSKLNSYISPSVLELSYGDTYDISDIKEYCSYSGASSCNKQWSYDISDSVTLSDDDVLFLDDKNITARRAGYSSLTVTLFSDTSEKKIPVSIGKKVITESDITLSSREFVYTGGSLTPSVTVNIDGKTLTEDTDYSLIYTDNVNVSSKGGYVTVSGIDNYDGTVNVYFMINSRDLSSGSIKLDSDTYEYTGDLIIPACTFTLDGKILENGRDYIISCSNNTDVGTATLSVCGYGNYKGRLDTTFSVVRGPSSPRQEEIITSSVKKTKITDYKAVKKTITVSWKKIKNTEGYEIQYSLNKKFKTSKTTSVECRPSVKKYTIKKLKRHKTYYIRIRGYRTSGNTKLCGAWSKTLKVTTK